MEGNDSEKPDQNDDEESYPQSEEANKATKTPSVPSSRGVSIQSAPLESATPVEKKSQSEEADKAAKIPSVPSSRGVSTQSAPLGSATPVEKKSLLKAPSTTFDAKSSAVLLSSPSRASPSVKNITSSSTFKASAVKFPSYAFERSEELADEAPRVPSKIGGKSKSVLGIPANLSGLGAFPATFFGKRSPFIHNPPEPEERRERIQCPRSPREYIINLREDLADFQESHGLPRTRDYSFVSLGLALAQETARAVYSVFLMFAELFPILSIVSLILRFALDKLIEILETPEPVVKLKKSIIFGLEMLVIVIPLWILIGTIVLPLVSLIFSIFTRVLRLKGGRKKSASKPKPKIKTETCSLFY